MDSLITPGVESVDALKLDTNYKCATTQYNYLPEYPQPRFPSARLTDSAMISSREDIILSRFLRLRNPELSESDLQFLQQPHVLKHLISVLESEPDALETLRKLPASFYQSNMKLTVDSLFACERINTDLFRHLVLIPESLDSMFRHSHTLLL